VEPGSPEEPTAHPVEHRDRAVAALEPLALGCPQALLGVSPLPRSDEASDLGILMERNELVQVRRCEGAQEQPFGFHEHRTECDLAAWALVGYGARDDERR
jgi:hypothetical protein